MLDTKGSGASRRKALFLASAAAGLAYGATALAQPAALAAAPSAAPTGLEEVIVTAERRAESLETVPVAISSISAAQVSQAHIETTYDLSSVTPGLTSYQATGFAMPHLRGIGNTVDSVGIENPVAVYVDGVFYASMTGSLLSLNNIERIEVDKGPQGTLFGRNATGGVIQITTRDPRPEFGGSVSAGYGNHNTANASLYVTGGLSDHLAADLAIYANDRVSGYGRNLHNGEKVGDQRDVAIRSKWLWTPDADDQARLILDYADSRGSAYVNNRYVSGTTPLGAPPFTSSNPWDVESQVQPKGWVKQGGVSLDLEHEFGFARLVNILAYRRTEADSTFTFSLFPLDIGANIGQAYSQFSEELQLLSRPESPVKWVVGLYYLDAPAKSRPFNLIGDFLPVIVGAPANPITHNTVSDRSEAVFGQATFPLPLGQTNLTLGLRYTSERRGITGDVGLIGIPASVVNFSASQTFSAPTWRVALDHRLNDQVMVYASASRGFRAGTYNGSGTSAQDLTTPVRPEHLTAYEAGLKGRFLAQRVQLNAAAFYYDYSNIQVPIYTATGVTVLSGPKATLYGADAELDVAATSRLTLRGGLSLLHTRFDSFPSAPFFSNAPGGGLIGFGAPATGKRLPVAPAVTFDLSATYRLPLADGAGLSISGNYAYEARWFSGPDNGLAAPSSNLVNGTATWQSPGDRYEVEVWGRNLLNEEIVSRLSEIAPWGDVETLQPPRTFGATLRVNF